MTAQAPTDGLIAGKYRLVRLLGRGGMGSVWEARHETLGSRVAIKFIEGELLDNPEARGRFETEARAAAQIDSKHAIRVDDYGVTDDGKPFIIMEVLEGEGLDKRIQRLGHLTMQDTARIVEQVCRALEKAHALGIVHRDLKPENIYLAKKHDDHEEVAKVLDFGIAKMISGGHASAKTRTGVMIGTPEFMSPEQVHGLDVDYRTDLWAMGVIAFRCITGALPFSGVGPMDIGLKIVQGPIPVPSQVAPHAPPAFDGWFARAVERDATRRFASARELAESLSMLAGHTAGNRASAPSTAELQTHAMNATAYAPTIATPGAGRTGLGVAAPPRSVQGSNGVLIGALAGVVALVVLGAGYATYSRVSGVSGDSREAAAAAATSRPAYLAPASAWSMPQAPSATGTSIPISALPTSRPTAAATSTGRGSECGCAPSDVQCNMLCSGETARVQTMPDGTHAAARGASSTAPTTKPTATAGPANMNCNPPYVVDASGTKKWKPECL